jgi:hypothetical protein
VVGKTQKRIRITGIVLGSIPLLFFVLRPIWGIIAFISEPLTVGIVNFFVYSTLLVPVAIVLGLVDLGMTLSRKNAAKKPEALVK